MLNRRKLFGFFAVAPFAAPAVANALVSSPPLPAESGWVTFPPLHFTGESGMEGIIPLRRRADGRLGVPRRISCDKGDIGYRTWLDTQANGQRVTVTLDGVEQKQCITADEGLGRVDRYVTTDQGNIVIDGDQALRETVFGRVNVEITGC